MNPLLKVVGDDGSRHEPRPLATAEDWRLRLHLDPQGETAEERSLPELIRWAEDSGAAVTVERGIHCVSAGGIAGARGSATFTGLPFAALAARHGLSSAVAANPEDGPTVEFVSRAPGSCGPKSRRHTTTLPLAYCLDPGYGVMLVWRLNGEPLPYPNGGPLRSAVGPRLFFYKGVKWLEEIRLHPHPPAELRGTWETYAGYHNLARVERNERFEPVVLRLADVVRNPEGQWENRLEEVPREEWVRVFEDAYRQRDLSRLVAAQLHKLLDPLPTDYAGFTFSSGPFHAQIRGTSFAGADFTGARMAGVNLSLSKLTNARFSRDGEDPADLSGGDFEGTYFNKAHLQNVNLRGATLTGATFFAERDFDRPTDRVRGLDVRGAKNLDPRTAEWLRRNGGWVDS